MAQVERSMRKCAATIILVLMASIQLCAFEKTARVPSFVFGTWKIYRVQEVGGHAGHDAAEKEIGKEFYLGKDVFRHDLNLLFFENKPCQNPRYNFTTRRFSQYDVVDKGTLLFYGLDAAKPNTVRQIVLHCRDAGGASFEVTKDNELALYYDGYFFFLKKVN
ncbi:MAG TPA: hypothetical protein VGV87_01710 [Blastocatellia bacterium]|nr:hypothetical protein [Blastocatellia bacterium]